MPISIRPFVFLAIAFFSFSEAVGQQLPLFSLYRENQGIINPASISSDFLLLREEQPLSIGVTYRTQRMGDAGQITTQTLKGEFIAVNENQFAPLLGMYLVNDEVGPTQMMGIYGRAANIFGLNHPNYGGFSLGLSFGAVQYRIKASEIELLDQDDVLGETDQSQWRPDVGVGLYFYKGFGQRGFESILAYGGISAAQLISLDLTFKGSSGEFPLTRTPHYYGVVGIYKFLDEFSFIELSSWSRYVKNAPISIDLNVRYQKGRLFWIGVGGSLNGNIHTEFGAFLFSLFNDVTVSGSNLKLGIGFDYSLVNYYGQTDRTIEINLAYLPGRLSR
jgi:type IX secretion system PorP/SprF family membrane protein